MNNPFKYRGYVYDWESGLFYLETRYYSPDWKRFIHADIHVCTGFAPLKVNQFAYCNNIVVHFADFSGSVPDDCTHMYFKNTYYISGLAFRGYLEWQFARHPKLAPEPPIIESIENAIQEFVVSRVVNRLKKLGEYGEKLHNYGSGILAPFLNYNYKTEEYIVDDMARKCSVPGGYKAVKIELLHGSHSAEVKLTLLGQDNSLIETEVIETQGYDVILDMMTAFDAIVEETRGLSSHEGVEWKYTMGN